MTIEKNDRDITGTKSTNSILCLQHTIQGQGNSTLINIDSDKTIRKISVRRERAVAVINAEDRSLHRGVYPESFQAA